MRNFKGEIAKKKKEFRELLLSSNTKAGEEAKKKTKLLERFIEDLFTEQPEIENWVDGKENLPGLETDDQ